MKIALAIMIEADQDSETLISYSEESLSDLLWIILRIIQKVGWLIGRTTLVLSLTPFETGFPLFHRYFHNVILASSGQSTITFVICIDFYYAATFTLTHDLQPKTCVSIGFQPTSTEIRLIIGQFFFAGFISFILHAATTGGQMGEEKVFWKANV